jgi:endogenous inhibitor of DNA gyrase (YacG/DUF329 family)
MIKVRCPICNRILQGTSAAAWPDFPFCSARCRLIDLGRWLGGDYAIRPTVEEELLSDPDGGLPDR